MGYLYTESDLPYVQMTTAHEHNLQIQINCQNIAVRYPDLQ